MKKVFSYKKIKVLIAISGGVDSAVAAALLKKQGFEVAGVFFRFFDPPKAGKADRNRNSAMLIAKKLGISLKIIDARKEFRKKIIDCFIESYKIGLTPNPCVICNREMKFDLLLRLLEKHSADFIATGHYALVKVRPFPSPTFRRGIPQGRTLCEAKDKTKDQSYFLYRLTQKDLAKIIFPLGDYRKSEVKKLAKKFKLPTLKDESQDICFLLGQDVNSYLGKCIKPKPGDIIDEKGNILGKHKGLPFYTIGQRKGIEIGGTGPYFVVGKNLRNNKLIVTNDPKKLLTKEFRVSEVNWVYPHTKIFRQRRFSVRVKTRYRAPKVSATIREIGNGSFEVRTVKKLRAVTPGQAAVFYKNREVLGGGVII